MKVVIIGGVAGGASAAARLRRLDENAEIVMLERTGFVSYANCGLPYYIGGVIEEKKKLTLQTPLSFAARFNVDARVKSEAVKIDRKNKTVTVKGPDGEEYLERYDKLILAPGAKAMRPDLPGLDDPRVLSLRTVEDAFAMRDFVVEKKPKKRVSKKVKAKAEKEAEEENEEDLDEKPGKKGPKKKPTRIRKGAVKLENILDLNATNIWDLDEYDIADAWERGREVEDFTISEQKLLNIIRLVFDVVHFDPENEREAAKFVNGGWEIITHCQEAKGCVAIRRSAIERITDLS